MKKAELTDAAIMQFFSQSHPAKGVGQPALTQQIATIAAKLVVEDGQSYQDAKQKAAVQLLGQGSKKRLKVQDYQAHLPDNALLEQHIEQHQSLFYGETQPVRLLQLRRIALKIMQELSDFNPLVTGDIVNGTAGQHSAIVLHLLVDNPKEVTFYFLNNGTQFDVEPYFINSDQTDTPHEILTFAHQQETVHCVVFDANFMRRNARNNKQMASANSQQLQQLILESST